MSECTYAKHTVRETDDDVQEKDYKCHREAKYKLKKKKKKDGEIYAVMESGDEYCKTHAERKVESYNSSAPSIRGAR